jgi:hypothetical protein
MSDYGEDTWTRRMMEDEALHRESERSRKRLMAIVSISAALTGGGLGYIYQSNVSIDDIQRKNVTIDYHLKMLEDTKKNLNALTEYVENQSTRLRSTNELLTELEKQRDRLKPLLETELDTVNALFRAQDERLRSQRIWDIIIAFLSGILASIFATALWTLLTDRLWKRQKRQQRTIAK